MDNDRLLNQEREAEGTSEFQEDYKDLLCTDLTFTEQRSLIFQLLYAIDAFDYDASLESIADNIYRGFGVIIPQESYAFQTALAVSSEREELDKLITPLIENWRFDRLGVATKLILRLSVWELQHTDTDAAVIINEAVELAKCFAEKDSYKFINGILDEFIKPSEENDSDAL